MVISSTIQEFNGVRYYLCGRYFQKQGKRLHRMVWTYNHGRIPAGYDIHHRDGDPKNNDPENLECIPEREHHSDRHGKEAAERAQPFTPEARLAAAAWHASPEGRAWHAEHFERNIRPVMQERIPAVCQECGEDYLVSLAKLKQSKFCGAVCRARDFRRRHPGYRARFT